MAKSTAAVIGRVLQIRLHGELTLDSRQDPLGHLTTTWSLSVPFPYRPSKIRDFLGKYKLALVVQSVAHKNKYKLVLVQSVARPDESSVQCAEELGHRLSTFRGTESNLYCTYCRFYNALYHHS